MSTKKLTLSLVAALVAAAPALAQETVNIGYSGPLSGGAAQYGEAVLEGMQMAAADLNRAGFDIAGKKVRFHIVALDDRVLLTVEPGNTAHVLAFLDRMRFMLRVAVRDVTDEWAVVWEPIRAAHATLPSILTPAIYAGLPMPDVGADVSNYRAPLESHFAGREVLVPRADLVAHLAARDDLAGTWAWNALRIAAGVPRFGVETDARTIPHELGLLGIAVHMRKGCYRGQETVAKVHTAARPPRRLVLLHLDGSDDVLPAHGTPIMLDGAEVGFLGMAVHHHELGPIASAVVRRSVPTDAVVEVADQRASQQLVVRPETAGETTRPVGAVRMRMLGHR